MMACPRSSASSDPDRGEIEAEDFLFLTPLVAVLLADGDDLAHDLDVEPVALGLGVDVLDVFGKRLLLLLEPLDALDEAAQMPGVDLLGPGDGRVLVRGFFHLQTSFRPPNSGRSHGRRSALRQD